ncbi:hypothetical protein KQI84_06990 [bacterium]|nr:hypothetical protein [bacterium]
MIRVECPLKDCAYYHQATGKFAKPEECDCSHPDKAMYLEAKKCPLYKKDWSSLNTASLAARFSRDRFSRK